MDRLSIIVVAVCLALIVVWTFVIVPKLAPKPSPVSITPSVTVTGTNAPGAVIGSTSTASPAALEAATVPAPVVANTNIAEEFLTVSNANARYTFSSYGGGLKQIELLRYRENVSDGRTPGLGANRVATLNSFTKAPTLALLGSEAVQGDGIFKLSPLPDGVQAEKTLTNGLSIVKTFQVSTNYLVFANVRLENRSAQPLSLPAQEWVVGTATPMNAQDSGANDGVMWFNGTKAQDVAGASYFATTSFGCMPRVPPPEYRGGQSNVFWAIAHNQFFALAVVPRDPAYQLVIRKVDLPAPSEEEANADSRIVRKPQGYEAKLLYPSQTLTAHQTNSQAVAIYAGPKEYRTLATVAATLDKNIDAVMGFGGFFGFFSKGLLLGMNWLHSALALSYGWTIIAITVIIKILFWPLTQASTRSAKRMQALQPQVKALQEKYKDDPVKAQRKMMEFYKENKVNPMSGCLPSLIQMPVFFGFFFMIRTAIELRGEHFLWVKDLSRPDTLFLIPGVGFPFNLLPLVMGATMLWQAHLTPPSPGMDPAQAKMMRYMPLMFLVFLYNYSAGLTLYWTVQNLLSVLQTKLTRTTSPPQPAAGLPKGPVLTSPAKRRK
jgi:YidC/Oxa1 family membrane protein insertase